MSDWPVIVERNLSHSLSRHFPRHGEKAAEHISEAAGDWQAGGQRPLGQLPPLMTRILAAREAGPESLDFSLTQLPDPSGLVSVAAIDLLLTHRNRKILVVADYDADGATACAVMVKGLSMLGFSQVGFLVPDRFVDGYGLTPALVERASQQQADVIITVDNGIVGLAGAEAARACGIKLLITDHHLPGSNLPVADAIVNPRLVPGFAGSELAGVGVAFYLLLALRRALRDAGDGHGNAGLVALLDLVALGTVADVVRLDRVNRVLVEQGLRRMRAGVCCFGIKALAQVAGRELSRLSSADMGFALGPRLNAAGRLADMSHGIDCLLAEDEASARQLAEELDAINRDRRQIEEGMQREAREQMAKLDLSEALPAAPCLYSADWHEGVVGLLASRIKERCQRPVFAFADSQQPGMLKGSGRSIPGLHLRDLLVEVSAIAPGVIDKFGGHAMAAGLSLAKVQLPSFRKLLQQVAMNHLTPDMLTRKVVVDGHLQETELTLANAEWLTLGSPWGQGFPVPLFHDSFEVLSQRLVAERHLKLTLGLPATNGVIDAIHFNANLDVWPQPDCKRIEAIYRFESNSYRGQLAPQLLLEHVRPA